MAAILVTGILALVLLVLGGAFTVVGLVIEEADSGEPEDFVRIGVAALAVGAALALAFTALLRRRRAAERRRTARTAAEVVAAELRPYVRIGVFITYDLAVRLPGAPEPVRRQVQVLPGTEPAPGGRIEVEYDPEDPANFDVVR